jgi:hypothetical protein
MMERVIIFICVREVEFSHKVGEKRFKGFKLRRERSIREGDSFIIRESSIRHNIKSFDDEIKDIIRNLGWGGEEKTSYLVFLGLRVSSRNFV